MNVCTKFRCNPFNSCWEIIWKLQMALERAGEIFQSIQVMFMYMITCKNLWAPMTLFFFTTSCFSSDIIKPQALQLHLNTITILHSRNTMITLGQKLRSQCEIAFYQANSPSGRWEWGAALCQRWNHLYPEGQMSLSGGGYRYNHFTPTM